MKKGSPALVILLIVLPVLITDITRVRSWSNVINADGYGYYAYLPCVFIYHHMDYQKVMDAEHMLRPGMDKAELEYPFLPGKLNLTKHVDKYFVGEAIVLTPFFLTAYFASYLTGFELSGYSALFQEAVVLAALFYLFIGLLFLRKLMLQFKVPDAVIYFALTLVVYATNLFYYATTEPSMSHVYSFALMTMFLYYAKCAIDLPRLKHLLFAVLLFSLLCIIRPTNVLAILLVPFLAGSFERMKLFVRSSFNLKNILILSGATLLVISMQLIKWKIETGYWFIWGYGSEGFDFAKPHIADLIFSYRKGWFVYTPLMLFILMVTAVLFLAKRMYWSLTSILLFFMISTYVFASWWEWWYGGSYGMRVSIDFYPLYALLFAIALTETKNKVGKSILVIVPVLCLMVSIIQTVQYNKFILSYDQMNKKRYWDVFLKTDDKYGWVYDDPASKLELYDKPKYHSGAGVLSSHEHSGAQALQITPASGMVQLCAFKATDIPTDTNVYMFVNIWGNIQSLTNDAVLVTRSVASNGAIHYNNIRSLADEMAGDNAWERIRYINPLLPVIPTEDSVKVYVRCSTGAIQLDDVKIEFGKLREGN